MDARLEAWAVDFMSYGTRLALAVREVLLTARAGGPKIACRMACRRVFRRSESMLFAKEGPFPALALPVSIHVETVTPEPGQAKRQEVFRAGAGPDVLNFDRGATCYMVYVEGGPAGVGWCFPESRLLRRLGLDRKGKYLGGFFVRPEFRGRGLYPLLLQTICREALDAEQTAFAETGYENLASQRGLTKAGFVCKGRLSVAALGA